MTANVIAAAFLGDPWAILELALALAGLAWLSDVVTGVRRLTRGRRR